MDLTTVIQAASRDKLSDQVCIKAALIGSDKTANLAFDLLELRLEVIILHESITPAIVQTGALEGNEVERCFCQPRAGASLVFLGEELFCQV